MTVFMIAETMISGDWILGAIKVVGVAIGAAGSAWIVAFRKGQKSTAKDVRIEEPVPEIPVRKVYTPPTFSQHQDLVRRVTLIEADAKAHREYVEAQLRDIRREGGEQFVKLMTAGEQRKDAIMESMNDMVRAFHSRVDQLLDGHRTTPRK